MKANRILSYHSVLIFALPSFRPGICVLTDLQLVDRLDIMTIEDLDSFDEPTILHLTRRYRLHPNACNPQMDLVALLYLPTQEEIDEGESSSVELWRTSGEQCVKVWDRDIAGYVVGMDWSLDGESYMMSKLVLIHCKVFSSLYCLIQGLGMRHPHRPTRWFTFLCTMAFPLRQSPSNIHMSLISRLGYL